VSAQAIPASSFDQARAALALGNHKRLQRAAVKRALRTKRLTLYEAFENEAASGMGIAALMECVPYLTPPKVSTILLIARIGYARPVGRLRPRDRWQIMHLLTERHPGIRVRP
jgi:hypothetical protein